MAEKQNQAKIQQIQTLKGGSKQDKKQKSKAKAMGLKSTLVFKDKIAITSFAKNKRDAKSSNLESLTSHNGDHIFESNPVLFKTRVDPETISIECKNAKTAFAIDKDFDGKLFFANPTKNMVGQDYIGIKSALEKRYFGTTFDGENFHVQIAYNIADIRKNLMLYINQIIYVCYNLNRQKGLEDNSYNPADIVGMIFFGNDIRTQQRTVQNWFPPEAQAREQKKFDDVMELLKNSAVYNSYFSDLFRQPKKAKGQDEASPQEKQACKEHNYNVLRIISMLRQACNHEKVPVPGVDGRNRNHIAENFLYNLEYELGDVCGDLIDMIDDVCQQALDKVNKNFVASSQNNLAVLKQLYPQVDETELVQNYYRHTIIKQNANLGVNMRLLREIFIMQYMPELSDKKYDTFRGKLYTVLGYVLADIVSQHPLLDDMVDQLRANTGGDEKRAQIYLDFAQKLWPACEKQARKTTSLFEEQKAKGFKDKLVFDKKAIECFGVNAKGVSCFAKIVLFVSKFLDKKETNELFASMEKKFNDIADLVESAKQCGESVAFAPQYKIFVKARKVAQELSLLKTVAIIKNSVAKQDQNYPAQMMLDAINMLGIDESVLNKEEIDETNVSYKQKLLDRLYGNKQNHQMRNFLINNVLKSRWFFYVIRYIKPKNCRELMKNKKIINFVLGEIPDTQIDRYHKSVFGYKNDNVQQQRNNLADRLVNFDLEKVFDDIEGMDKKDFKSQHPNSLKEKNKAIVGLYMTVAYLAVKNMVAVNSRFAIAFGCYERDYQLLNLGGGKKDKQDGSEKDNLDGSKKDKRNGKEKDEDHFIRITQDFVNKDKPFAKQFEQKRNEIRDSDNTKEQKRQQYKVLKDVAKQMHFSLHQYYCISQNVQTVNSLQNNGIVIHTTYRNFVAHLNVLNNFAKQANSIGQIKSYYQLYMYTLQKTLLEDRARFFNTKDDDFANYCKKCRQIIYQNKTYSRDFSWVLNVPFAYNVARYKNLSIEDLFVGKNSKQKIVAPNPHEVVANEPTQTEQQPQQNDFAQKPQTVTSDANIGTVAYMTKTEVTSRGGIKGKVCDKNANISPKHLKEKRMFAERLAGKNLKVIVTRWDDNAGVYVCELAPLGPRR